MTSTIAPILSQADLDIRPHVLNFLAQETMLLEEDRLWDWYSLLDEDFVYEVPIRTVRERRHGEKSWPKEAYHQRDTKGSIKIRIDKIMSGVSWAEDPATRVARVVSNVAIQPQEDDGVIRAKSSIIIYREYPQVLEADILAGRRVDEIAVRDGEFKLLSRRVLLAQTTLKTPNLAFFM